MKDPIVIAGLYRSGTTWLYNLVRNLYLEAGMGVWGGGTHEYMNADLGPQTVPVVKEHRYIGWLAQEASIVLNARRDLKEIKRSWTHFKGAVPTQGQINNWMHDFERWSAMADYCMDFAELDSPSGPERIAERVAYLLGVESMVNLDWVLAETERDMKPPIRVRKDPHTLVFTNHFTSRSYEDTCRHHQPGSP